MLQKCKKNNRDNTKKRKNCYMKVAVFNWGNAVALILVRMRANLCNVSHVFNYVASCDTIWYTCVPNLIVLVLFNNLQMTTFVRSHNVIT